MNVLTASLRMSRKAHGFVPWYNNWSADLDNKQGLLLLNSIKKS
jgi:hypothetical protein